MNARQKVSLPLLALAFTLSACIDDPATVDEGLIPITPEEAQLLGVEIWRDAFEARVVPDDGAAADVPAALAAAPVPVSGSADTTVACPDGGSIYAAVAVAGTLDDETGAALLDFSMLAVHRDCRETHDGQLFRLNGAPGVTMLLRLISDGQGATDLLGSVAISNPPATDPRRSVAPWPSGSRSPRMGAAAGATSRWRSPVARMPMGPAP